MMLQKFSLSLGAPYLLALLALGLLFGNYGIISVGHIGYPFAQRSCEVALIFIMFYGGFDTRWRPAKKVLAEASLLSTMGVLITAALTVRASPERQNEQKGMILHVEIKEKWES